MTRRWLLLLALVPAAALVLGVLARRPHTEAPRPQSVTAASEIDLSLTLDAGRVEPKHTAVPEGRRVRLVVRNAGGDTADLRLAGLEDELEVASDDRLLRPPAVEDAPFLADHDDRLMVDLPGRAVEVGLDTRRARFVQSSRGTNSARASGMRDHGATSTTVQTEPEPVLART